MEYWTFTCTIIKVGSYVTQIKESEINEIETKRAIAKINESKSRFFEKMNNVVKPLARLIKKKRRSLKSIKLEMKKKIQLTLQEMQGIIRGYYK